MIKMIAQFSDVYEDVINIYNECFCWINYAKIKLQYEINKLKKWCIVTILTWKLSSSFKV